MNTIYLLIDPRTGLVRYVGVTAQALQRRIAAHLREARRSGVSHRLSWLRQLQAEGVTPLVVVIEHTNDRNRECFWITHYRTAGCSLVNSTDGGDGVLGYRHTETSKDRIRAGVTEDRYTPERAARISVALQTKWREDIDYREHMTRVTAHPHTAASKSKMSASHQGKRRGPHSEIHRQRIAEGQRRRWTRQKDFQ